MIPLNTKNIYDILEEAFFSYNQKAIDDLRSNSKSDFVHYTSAEVAHNILSNQKVWLRNVSCMNDFQEIYHGQKLLKEAFHKNDKLLLKKLTSILSDIDSKNKLEWEKVIEETLNYSHFWERSHAYIFCLSEHQTSEINHGRLSMWRAYGGQNSTAIVLDSKKILDMQIEGIFITKVVYGDSNTISKLLEAFIKNIKTYAPRLKEINVQRPNLIERYLIRALICAMISIKHEGFIEEKEWRVVHLEGELCQYLNPEIKSINGIPQKIYVLDMNDFFFSIFKNIIIGPSQFTPILYQTFENDIKQKIKIKTSSDYIKISGIPLRPL